MSDQPPSSVASEGRTAMCLAREWQRDGRGLWAMRACQYYQGHGKSHSFGQWKYNVAPLEALLGRLPADHAVSGEARPSPWLPIASAPKDGTMVVVVGNLPDDSPGFHRRACVSRWSERPSDTPAYVARGWVFMAPGYSSSFNPTHWMPLPAPSGAGSALPPLSTQDELNNAILYALREGCFFPVPEPSTDADVRAWVQWGAMRNLHTAIARHFGSSGPALPQPAHGPDGV